MHEARASGSTTDKACCAAASSKPALVMLDAGNEELFDIQENSGKAYGILKAQDAVPFDTR